ncbi:MAG: hypothetical protein EA352_09035 [Gemmatimonadales bacterium]|nr:MAG: hypothetical protein EA352_09035 [Gemmatimonadales bacterium]
MSPRGPDGPSDSHDLSPRVGGERRPLPPLPEDRPRTFRATVHGTVFGEREKVLDHVRTGDDLLLIPDPPVGSNPEVWVHRRSGEPVGRLPTEIGRWLAPWLLAGGHARARAERVSGPETPSWRRLLLSVRCSGQ